MQKICITILICLCWTFTYSQYFSGEIQYKTTIIDKETGQLIRIHTANLLIGEGYYRYRANTQHEFTYEITYLRGDNKYYSEAASRPYILYFWKNDSTSTYTPYTLYKDSIDNVLNQSVTLATRTYSKFEEKLYISDALRIDPKDYKKFNYAQFNKRSMQFGGRIMLKSIQEREEVFIVTEAVKIRRKKWKSRNFQFPKDKNIAARYDRTLQSDPYFKNLTKDYANCLYTKTNKKSQYYDAAYIEKHTKSVSFKMIWTKEKEIKNLTIIKSDDEMLNQKAIDIINDCKPNFGVIKLNDLPVDMEIFYNVVFFEELTEDE